MNLTPKLVDGYTVLVDENTEIKEGICLRYVQDIPYIMKYDKGIDHKQYKIIFADPELNLDLPIVPDWEQFHVEELAIKKFSNSQFHTTYRIGFIEGYNEYKDKKYTEEDLIKAMIMYIEQYKDVSKSAIQIRMDIIQSLKKLLKYIVVESEDVWIDTPQGKINKTWQGLPMSKEKLITLPNGDVTGVIKEVIWE